MPITFQRPTSSLSRFYLASQCRDAIKKSDLFDTSHWTEMRAVTLTLKQARKADDGRTIWLDEDRCNKTFRHFMRLLNRSVFGKAARRGKRLKVIPVLEKGAVPSTDKATRWHYHATVEPPAHMKPEEFEQSIRDCWERTDWGYDQIKVKTADYEWVNYTTKPSQKSEFEAWSDCIDLGSLHNPIVGA